MTLYCEGMAVTAALEAELSFRTKEASERRSFICERSFFVVYLQQNKKKEVYILCFCFLLIFIFSFFKKYSPRAL